METLKKHLSPVLIQNTIIIPGGWMLMDVLRGGTPTGKEGGREGEGERGRGGGREGGREGGNIITNKARIKACNLYMHSCLINRYYDIKLDIKLDVVASIQATGSSPHNPHLVICLAAACYPGQLNFLYTSVL